MTKLAEIKSPMNTASLKIHEGTINGYSITLIDPDEIAVMKLNRRGLVELRDALNKILEGE